MPTEFSDHYDANHPTKVDWSDPHYATLECPACGEFSFEFRSWSGEGYDEAGHECTNCKYQEI